MIERTPLNDDLIATYWQQIRGKLKARWDKLTDDDLGVTDGGIGCLADRLHVCYGVAGTEANLQVAEFNLDEMEDDNLAI